MKKIIVLSIMSVGLLVAGPVCDFKAQEIQEDLQKATQNNNKKQISGLNKALKELKEHCSDNVVLLEAKTKVEKLKLKVTEVEEKLDKEKQKGKASRIKKAEQKLELTKTELENAQKDLDNLEKLK